MTQATIDEAMRIAIAHHGAGRLAEAEGIYRQVLGQLPDHPDALHLLGLVAFQTGHLDAAGDLMARAIAVNPGVAPFHCNLGEVYRRQGRREEALACFRRALELVPGLAAAHNNMGIILSDQGRLEEACAAYSRAVAHDPGHAEAHNNLGCALNAQGRIDEAIAAYRRAIALKPDYAKAYSNLGNALRERKQHAEAIAACREAARLMPELAEAQSNLGVALREQGRPEQAVGAYRRALALKPTYAEAHNNLGTALADLGHHDEAMAALRRAIALRPGYAEAFSNLGHVLKELGRLDEAIEAHRRAIALKPDHAGAYTNLGNALKEQGRLDEALAAYQRAIALDPTDWLPANNLGDAFKEQGRLDKALASFQQAAALLPQDAKAASNYLFSLHYHPGYDAQAILAEHRRWARQYAEPLAAEIRLHSNDPDPDRRLRVGFVSPDLREHPVGRSLLPILRHHDRARAEFFCYSDARLEDALSEQLKALCGHWQRIAGQAEDQVAERIRADRIDILVDLALHSANNLMLVFARKPAPVQVTMIGMPATTGLATIDYRLTDPYLDPPGETDLAYTEQSIRLPHSFWCYEPPDEAPPVSDSPARARGFVTFACVNQFVKVSPAALGLWIEILQALPTARLVIESQPGSHREAVQARFGEQGIAPERVEFAAKLPRADYFRRFGTLDIGLDPFPYNGHTSTLDALWMGVPVITLRGGTAVGRGGVSILSNVGLTGLIAESPEEYVRLAVEWASDIPRLAALRAGLRQRVQASPLLDATQYAADVAAALRQMWQNWCRR